MQSTIDLILIKGQVLDNPELRLIFIDACEYKNYNMKKINCSMNPYMNFKKILENYF